MGAPRGTPEERFRRYFTLPGDLNECWEWRGAKRSDGYGVMSIAGETWRAHRFSYILHGGLIPEGLSLDHLCRNRACVNPAHLEPVTRGENVIRGLPHQKRKSECIHGHPRKLGKNCQECHRVSNRAYARRQRGLRVNG